MNTVFKLSHAITRHLVRGALVALLVSQFAWADHFHLDQDQNADCSVCVFVDNTPVVANEEGVQPAALDFVEVLSLKRSENLLTPPSFNHHSRAPPAH